MKRENRKINKENLTEVTGNRIELSKYLGEKLKVHCFVTNTNGFLGDKRLINEVYVKDLYINHLWLKTENIGNLSHGYQDLEVKVIHYTDKITNEDKYGLKYLGKEGRIKRNNKLIKPKWMDQYLNLNKENL